MFQTNKTCVSSLTPACFSDSLLLLSNISLVEHTKMCLSIHLLVGNLGYFKIFGIIKRTPIFVFSFLSSNYLGVKLLVIIQ